MFWFWTSQLHAFVFPARVLGCRKSSASTGVIQIKVLTTLPLKFQVSMVKIKNPNWTIRKDIDFVFFGKSVIANEGSIRTHNFLRLNRNLLIGSTTNFNFNLWLYQQNCFFPNGMLQIFNLCRRKPEIREERGI